MPPPSTTRDAQRTRPRHLVVPDLGVGIGLRVPHYAAILAGQPELGFFEAISENYFGGGKPRYHLERIAERYPIVLHGVSLGIGGPHEPDLEHLGRLKELARLVRAPWLSDHLCWTGSGHVHLHDLLPLPHTSAVVERIARRARMIQDFLELPFALENTSSYLGFARSELSEWEFVSEVVEAADVGLLLDVNNIYVSAFNHDYDPVEFLKHIPHERVLQIHMAGHTHFGTHIIDTHVGPTPGPVLDLYGEAVRLTGSVSTLVEWDQDIPELPVVLAEARRLQAARNAAAGEGQPPGAAAEISPVASARGRAGSRFGVPHGGAAGSLSAWAAEPSREPSGEPG